MILTSYTSPYHNPAIVRARYVKAATMPQHGREYFWCEVSKARYDVRQGYCSREDLPADVADKADRLKGMAFNSVDWPL